MLRAPTAQIQSNCLRLGGSIIAARPTGHNLCTFGPLPKDPVTVGEWGTVPLPAPAPDGLALVILTVSNSNNIQDDSWNFLLDGGFVAHYDGGGATSISYYAYLPIGATHELTAEDMADNGSSNYFQVDVSVDGVNVLSTDSVNGVVGDTVTVGSFDT